MAQPVYPAAAGHRAPGQPVSGIRKQDLTVYTVMLGISLLAVLAGTIIMFLELQRWGAWPGTLPWRTDGAQIRQTQVETPWFQEMLKPVRRNQDLA